MLTRSTLKNKTITRRLAVTSVALGSLITVLLSSVLAEATLPITTCYLFRSDDTPTRVAREDGRTETWCYRPIEQMPGALFIYNTDSGVVKLELSAVVEPDGTLVHGSLLAGNVTFHRLKSSYNPFPVPLNPPADGEIVASPHDEKLRVSANDALKTLLSEYATTEDISIQEGEISALASAAAMPWRGYWWPYSSGRLHSGSNPPLEKFDRYVKARTGTNPGARAWEKSYHRYAGVNWEGHCNGWTASSILRSEPRSSIHDRRSGVTFTVSDLKGLLAEKDNCVKYSFFGRRYSGRSGDDLNDIYASEFHSTITYYIGKLRKPIVMDRLRTRGVDNHVVSGYSMNIVKSASNRFTVTTTLKVHGYDKSPYNTPGSAPSYSKTFKYYLFVDSDGKVTGSQWLSTNPDFLWVPLSTAQCSPTNPRITEAWIESIFNN